MSRDVLIVSQPVVRTVEHLKQLKQRGRLRDIVLKHRLSTSAREWNRREDDVYFRAYRREDNAGVRTATNGGVVMESTPRRRP
jgi:hypothetical protein